MKSMVIQEQKDFSELQDSTVKEQLYIQSEKTVSENEKKGTLVNLGIYQTKKDIRTNKYVGFSWLKDMNGDIIEDDSNRYVIHISSHFDKINASELLNLIMQEGDDQDDELIDYLYLESDNPAEKMITFFFDEELIDNINKDEAFEGSLFSVLIYISLLYKLLKRNMLRKIFRNEANYVGKIRGKICMNKQISKNLATGHQERIYCKFNERSEDILENQILKYALKMADEYLQENKFSNDELQRKISWCRNKLANVSEVKCNRNDILKAKRNIPNFYKEYISVLDFAKIIIENEAVMDSGNEETISIVPYAINMPLLYECYVRSRIKQFLKNYKKDYYDIQLLKYVKNKKLNDYDENVYGAKRVASKKCYIDGWIFPDIVLKYIPKEENGDTAIFYRVYDVKYKDFSAYRNSSSVRDDRLQLLAYNKMYKTNNNTGFIVPELSLDKVEIQILNKYERKPDVDQRMLYSDFVMKPKANSLLEEAIKP